MYMIHLCLFYFQNVEYKKGRGLIEIFIAFSLLLLAEDLILLARRSALLTMNLQPGNEPTSSSTYLPFSLLVLLANCTDIPQSLSFRGKWKNLKDVQYFLCEM